MADLNIDAQGSITPHNLPLTIGTSSIEVEAAQACTLSFPNDNNCFGQSSVPLVLGLNTVAVVNNITTDGSVTGTRRQNPDTFEITFGN